MIYTPYPYQQFATEFILSHPASGVFLDMGLGKSVITLTAIDELIYDRLEITKVLVIAPLMVARSTWVAEVNKWEHISHLRISRVLGSAPERARALEATADVYVINRENVKWLVDKYETCFPFDMIVIDELSSFKNARSQRFKALRKVRPYVRRIVGLTGTPAPNGLLDLWPQVYLLDQGERLSRFITHYRDQYFKAGRRNGQIIFDWKLKPGADKQIYEKISDICMTMKSEDFVALPERVDVMVDVELPPSVLKQYEKFERELIMSLPETQVTAINAAALTNKLLQLANGAVYDEDHKHYSLHDEKLIALEEIIEGAVGKSVLVFYSYQHDLARIIPRLEAYNIRIMKGEKDVEDWNAGKIEVMLAHPASAGHGLNLQNGGSIIVWFGMPWSLELYQQANKRLHRRGQTDRVIVHHLVAKGTLDEQVMRVLSSKDKTQNDLIEAIKARVKEYKHEKPKETVAARA